MVFDHPVCFNPNKVGHQLYYFMKFIITSFKISICFYLFIFPKKSQGSKYGDQNVHFFDVTPYIIFTHPVIFMFIIAYMTSMEYKLSNDI